MKRPIKLTPEECIAAYMAVQKAGYSSDLTAAICKKLIAAISFSKRGRPKKSVGRDDDTLRALIVDHSTERFPEFTVAERIEHARFMADIAEQFRTVPEFRAWFPPEILAEMDAEGGSLAREIHKLLPASQTLEASLVQSVSRGREKLRK